MIALRALGKTEIVTPTGTLTPSQEIVFAAALYLLLERAKPVTRATFAGALWPGIAEVPRQHRLRQTILQLKNAGVPLEARRDSVLLPAEERQSDLDVLFVHDAGDIGAVESLQFLPGYAPTFSRAYADWLDGKRREVSAATSRLLINDIRRARSRGDWLRVERLALKCMDVDPFNEEAVLARAEASAMRGAKREAVSILDRYVADLGPGSADIKLPASLMRKRIAERVPEAAMAGKTESIFVGRETDMSVLTKLLDDARGGEGRCCLLWGDPGIGKSRLASELGRFGELQGVQMRRVACRRGDNQRPLSVFVEAVPQLREMRGALGCSPDTMSDLQRLTQFDIGSGARQAMELDPQSTFELIRLAIFDLIDAVSEEQCLMLVIEDVHWMDAASARILGQLADWSAKKRILLLFTSRLRENPLLEACTRAGLIAHHIRPLSDEAAIALVSEMFEATNERRDEEFFEWCRKVGDGNPFFLHELVKQWLETKQRHTMPPSLMTVIRERFSRLSAEGTQLLQACSILGEQSTLPRVEKMLQQEPYMLLGALSELSKASMLSPERKITSSSGDFHLRPRHDLVATVALQELDPHATAFLHRRAAEVLEGELGGDVQDTAMLWACAKHWQQAGDNEKAFAQALTSAQQLMRFGLSHEAAGAFHKVREYCTSPEQLREVLSLEIDALERSQSWTQLIHVIEELRSNSETQKHDNLEIKSLNATWRVVLDTSDVLDHALRCAADKTASSIHRLEAAAIAMKIASNEGKWRLLEEIYELVIPSLTAFELTHEARAEVDMIFHSMRGDLGTATLAASALVPAVKRTRNINRIVRALTNASDVFRLAGDEERARAMQTEAVELAAMHRCRGLTRWALLGLIRMNLDQGLPNQARQNLESIGGESFDEEEDPIARINYENVMTRLLIEEGQLEPAISKCEHLLAGVDKLPRPRVGAVLATAVNLYSRLPSHSQHLARLVEDLRRNHLEFRSAGWQDYEAYSLYLGICALGDKRGAAHLLAEYVSVRRDTSQLPKEIAISLSRA